MQGAVIENGLAQLHKITVARDLGTQVAVICSHKIEFSFLKNILMVPTDHLIILSYGGSTCRDDRVEGKHAMSLDPPVRDAMFAAIPRLRAFATLLCGNADRGDDLIRRTLLQCAADISSHLPGSDLLLWLFTILHKQFYCESRKQPMCRSRDELVEKTGAYAMQAAGAKFVEFSAAFSRLCAEQREALILVGASGFSQADAAKICGCAEGTIKSRVHRGRTRLAEVLSIESANNFKHIHVDRRGSPTLRH
jgi:RNA polymerase sigma-70 factor (ECF subfamily)